MRVHLDFEIPLIELENKIKELELFSEQKGVDLSGEINKLKEKFDKLSKEIFSSLTPWQKVQIARHPARPLGKDYIENIFTDFIELHGDRCYMDDHSIITGLGKLEDMKVMLIVQHKGRDVKEKIKCSFGSPHPEGYRKALHKMKLAEKFNIPILTIIDTPGAFPGIEAEEHNQSYAISYNLQEMARLKVPIVSVVIGEGGSGGALAIGVCDRLLMLEYSYYSVISPEGCAAILWKDSSKADKAASALKLTAQDLLSLGICDDIIPEPPRAAHSNPQLTYKNFRDFTLKHLKQLSAIPIEKLLEERYNKYRKIGCYRIFQEEGNPYTIGEQKDEK